MTQKDFLITKQTYAEFFADATWQEILRAYCELRNLADRNSDTVLGRFGVLGFMTCYNELERRFGERTAKK